MTNVSLARTFCAHEANPLGVQALGILRQFGAQNILPIRGGDPIAPSGSVLFLTIPVGVCRSSFLRKHSPASTHRGDVDRQQFLEEHMPWALSSEVAFINPEFARCGGLFGGKPLKGFTFALAGLAGYVSPMTIANRARKKRRWLEGSRDEPRDRHYYFA